MCCDQGLRGTQQQEERSGAPGKVHCQCTQQHAGYGCGGQATVFTDAHSNSKPYKKGKLDYSGSSRSTHMIKAKGAGITREHRLVAKVLGMGHDLDDMTDDCSVSC